MAGSDERVWTIDADETGEVSPDDVAEAMIELGGMMRRLGGAVNMGARRTQVGPELYITEQIVIRWSLHLPLPRGRRRPEPVPEEEPVEDDGQPELEPEAA